MVAQRKKGDSRLSKVKPDTVVYAVGDIHGCANLLEQIHQLILRDAEKTRCSRRVVVYLGDYVDRGDDPRAVVDLLLDDPLPGFESVYLMGNHEEFLLDFLEDPQNGPGWVFNGGNTTLASYGIKVDHQFLFAYDALKRLQDEFKRRLPKRHLDFYRSLGLCHTEGDYFFVHAGVRPGIPLNNQSDEDLLWIREEFLNSKADHGKIVVHGHTITWEPELRDNRIGIDTGAFASGVLTALVLEADEKDLLHATTAKPQRVVKGR